MAAASAGPAYAVITLGAAGLVAPAAVTAVLGGALVGSVWRSSRGAARAHRERTVWSLLLLEALSYTGIAGAGYIFSLIAAVIAILLTGAPL